MAQQQSLALPTPFASAIVIKPRASASHNASPDTRHVSMLIPSDWWNKMCPSLPDTSIKHYMQHSFAKDFLINDLSSQEISAATQGVTQGDFPKASVNKGDVLVEFKLSTAVLAELLTHNAAFRHVASTEVREHAITQLHDGLVNYLAQNTQVRALYGGRFTNTDNALTQLIASEQHSIETLATPDKTLLDGAKGYTHAFAEQMQENVSNALEILVALEHGAQQNNATYASAAGN